MNVFFFPPEKPDHLNLSSIDLEIMRNLADKIMRKDFRLLGSAPTWH